MTEPLDTGKEVEDGLNPEAMIRKDRYAFTFCRRRYQADTHMTGS